MYFVDYPGYISFVEYVFDCQESVLGGREGRPQGDLGSQDGED